MKNLFLNFKKLIFDNSCINCGEILKNDNLYLCSKCYKILEKTASLKKKDDLYFVWEYSDIIKRLVENFKFNNICNLADILGDVIFEQIFDVLEKEEIDYVIPVPVSKKRQIERGFNQVEEVLKSAGIDYIKAKRRKNTEHMYKIRSKEERMKNIKGSFFVPFKLNDKKILLVDDIITTGSTFFELKNEIEKNNSGVKIYYFAIARAKNYKYGE